MVVPTTRYALGVWLILVLPGVVYAAVRIAVQGFRAHDREIGARLLQAVFVGALLDAVYLLILGDHVVDLLDGRKGDPFDRPRVAALAVLILGFAVPATVAYLVHGRPMWKRLGVRGLGWVRVPIVATGYEPTPTAWDKAAPSLGGHWVRIRVADGQWVGGWFGNKSYISTYPEPRDIYVEDQHHVDDAGVIGEPVHGSAGFWMAITDEHIVEWIKP